MVIQQIVIPPTNNKKPVRYCVWGWVYINFDTKSVVQCSAFNNYGFVVQVLDVLVEEDWTTKGHSATVFPWPVGLLNDATFIDDWRLCNDCTDLFLALFLNFGYSLPRVSATVLR